MNRKHAWFPLFVVLVCLTAAARGDERGTIKGRFVFAGDPPEPAPLRIPPGMAPVGVPQPVAEDLVVDPKSKGIANVVVFIRGKDVKVNPQVDKAARAKPVVLTARNMRFAPHVVVVQTGQDLQLTNGDPAGHNVNISSIGNPVVNTIVPAGGQPAVQFAEDEPLPVRVRDNIHPWMKAWVVVRSNPYAAVTQADGSFEIPGVPVGEIELQLWHEKAGSLAGVATTLGKADDKGRLKVEVKAAGTNLGDITITPDALHR